MNPSYHIVGLVRKKISTKYVKASDTDVARAIGVSRAAVSAYKAGRDVMSPLTLAQAQEILELPPEELADYSLMLSMEATPQAKAVWAAHQYVLDQAKKYARSILLATLGLIGLASPTPSTAYSSASAEECILW